MEAEKEKYAVVELKYDEGKVVIVRRFWILKSKKLYIKTDDEFCYWCANLDDDPYDMKCEYSEKFTGEPALFKVFVIKLVDTLEEAEKSVQGRLKFVSNKFREPGNTDEEIKKMESKRKRSEKKELKTQKAQAHALNLQYLINDVKLQAPSTSSSILPIPEFTDSNNEEEENRNSSDEEIREPIIKKAKQNYSLERSEPRSEPLVKEKKKKKDQKRSKVEALITSVELNDETEVCAKSNEIDTSPKLNDKPKKKKKKRSSGTETQESNLTVMAMNATSNISSSSMALSDNISPLCELPSTTFGFSLTDLTRDLVHSILTDNEQDIRNEDYVSEQLEVPPLATLTIPEIVSISNELNASNNMDRVDNYGGNIIVLNFDELTTKYNDALSEILKLKVENDNLKIELAKADRRNKLLQDYLVDVDERVPELLFEEKDGGRLYRHNVFISKKQCAVLDKAKSDNEFLNNLLICVFGRDVLKTHTLTGKRSFKKKEENTSAPAQPAKTLDKNRVGLIYDIMNAHAVANKTKKLTKTEINAIISKKTSNLASYEEKSIQEN